MTFIPETALSLLDLGFVIMSDSTAVLSARRLSGLNIYIVLVFFKNLKLVRNRYFKEVDEYIVIFEFASLLRSIIISLFFPI